jgi:hypothetical protein
MLLAHVAQNAAFGPVRCIAVSIHASSCNFAVGRGHRLPSTLDAIAARNALLIVTADRHFAGMSDRQAAAHLHVALARYAAGRWLSAARISLTHSRRRCGWSCAPAITRRAPARSGARWLFMAHAFGCDCLDHY